MALISLNIGDVVKNCPNLEIPDNTDYTSSSVFVYSDFKFHDYTSGLPQLNATITFDTFAFGIHTFSGVSIEIETDGAGNVINPEVQYLALADALNAASTAQINIELVRPADTGYRDWYLRISSDTVTGYEGASTSVNVSGGTITPLFATISNGTDITVRNLTLTDKDGNVLDLGAQAQIDELELSGTYTVGETFNIDFCNDNVTYVVTNENSAECVAAGIMSAIIAKKGGLFEKYVSVEKNGGNLVFTSTEAGVPLDIAVGFTGSETFVFGNTTPNIPSMELPSYTSSDSVTYKTNERGGKYTATLTVVSDCDYNSDVVEFFSWCYDLTNFDCCFVSLVKKKGGCCKSKDSQLKASTLRNIIIAVPKMIDKGESESNIQKVVDMGWSICSPLNCGCSNCS